MKKWHIFSLILMTALFSPISQKSYGAENDGMNQNLYPNTDITSIEFTQTGHPLIYSDYPETIYEEGVIRSGAEVHISVCNNQIGVINGVDYGIGKYFNKVEIKAGQVYTAEFYNGRMSQNQVPYLFGVAFINNGTEDVEIIISKSGQHSYPATDFISMARDTQFQFFRSQYSVETLAQWDGLKSIPRELTIPSQQGHIAIFEEATGLQGYVNGKIQFVSDKDITLLQFYALSNEIKGELSKQGYEQLTQKNLDEANLYHLLSIIGEEGNRVNSLDDSPFWYTTTTGILNYDTRTATIDAPVGTKFYLNVAGHINGIRDFNINEYEPLDENDMGGFPVGDIMIHDGNYSIIYDITLENAQGKIIKVTPYKEEGKTTSSGAIFYTSQMGWFCPTPNADVWYIEVPDDGQFQYILPGSVYGDILFEIVEPSLETLSLDNSYDAWAESYIRNSIYEGLIPLAIQKDYRNPITREEFCQLAVQLWVTANQSTLEKLLVQKGLTLDFDTFTDTKDEKILAAYQLGIVQGVGNGRFAPESPITRQEAAVMIFNTYKALELPIQRAQLVPYTDDNAMSAWAKESIYYLQDTGIFTGTGNNLFNPLSSITRQESIVLMYKLLETSKIDAIDL